MSGMPTFPVVVGLAVGVAFVITFSVLAGPTFPTDIETRHVILAIDDLKDTYKSGESIVFRVTAIGVLDNACNHSSPSVVMRDESNGKTMYWPEPFGFSTAIRCPTEEIDREWTFGEDLKKEIVLDMPGHYSVIASYEGASMEKKFSVQ